MVVSCNHDAKFRSSWLLPSGIGDRLWEVLIALLVLLEYLIEVLSWFLLHSLP